MASLIVSFPVGMEVPPPTPRILDVNISTIAALIMYAPHYLCACSSFLFHFYFAFLASNSF